VFIHPLLRGQVEDASNYLQAVVDGANRDPLAFSLLDPRLQCSAMEFVERHLTDPWQ
jgi:hypothetical protein